MRNIIRRLAGRYAVLFIVVTIVFAGFEFIMPAVISTLYLPSILGNMLALLPPGAATTLVDQIFGGLSPIGLLGYGWNHPIAHAVGTALAAVLGARAVAGEADNGMLELVLAQPISRTSYLAAHLSFALLALALFCALGVLGTFIGVRLFEVADVPMLRIGFVAGNFFLLLTVIYAATLLASVLAREGGRALGVGVLITVVSFLLFTIALLWPDAAVLRTYTLHNYYVPRDLLVTGTIAPLPLAVLIGSSLLCLSLAFWRFNRRDIT